MEENSPNQGTSKPAIRFKCTFCGQQIRVSSIHAGKKAKCPKCKNIVIIPQSAQPHPSQEDEPIRLKRDSDFLDQTPRSSHPPAAEILTEDQQIQMLRDAAGFSSLEPLYPANIQGLIFLGIVILIPLFFRILALLLGIFAIFLLFPGLIIGPVIGAYTYWYFAQCVRESALGNIRAPDIIAETPGVWELIGRLLQIFACLAVCAAPLAAYYGYTRRIDLTFWILAGGGAFIYPMTLLGVLMFDSIAGLNPIIIIPSILTNFFPYCGLVILIGAVLFLLVQTQKLLQPGLLGFLLYPLLRILELYMAMIAAHLLGRFYFRYKEKLNWEV
jgi:phage FluMu protein Com